MSPWQVITICTILLRRAAQICPPICLRLRGTVCQFLHSRNPFKIPACGGLFSPYGKSFRPEVAYGKSFRPDTPHPRRGASVGLSEGESDQGFFFPPMVGGKWKFEDYFPPIFRDPGGKFSLFPPPHVGGKCPPQAENF